MNELIEMIQTDQELWEIVEHLKQVDESLEDFILSVSQMLSIEFDALHQTDLSDKLSALFGGLPPKAFNMAPLMLHIALELFLMRSIPDHSAVRD
jgi:hypothetical protein